MVTREELRQALWPSDTYVEFDGSLNAALKRLRFALGDSARNPTFIETLPKHGYRFIAPVAVEDPAHASQLVASLPGPLASANGEAVFPPVLGRPPLEQRRSSGGKARWPLSKPSGFPGTLEQRAGGGKQRFTVLPIRLRGAADHT